MQYAVTITTEVVSSTHTIGDVYSVRLYAMQFVS